MIKKYLIFITIVFTAFLLFWFAHNEKQLNYDNYKEMESLSQISNIDLKEKGYSDFDISKIKEFKANYNNHLILLDIIINDKLKSYGYDNRIIDNGVNCDVVYDENIFIKQKENISYNTTVWDITRDQEANRDAARVIIEFEWASIPVTQKQTIRLDYHNYIPKNIYTCLKYENTNNKNDVVYKMCELEPKNFLDTFHADIVSRKTSNQQNYILKSGIIVLDLKSYYENENIAPLTILSDFAVTTFWGKEKILSKQKITNVETRVL